MAGFLRERMMGFEPTTCCMATRPRLQRCATSCSETALQIAFCKPGYALTMHSKALPRSPTLAERLQRTAVYRATTPKSPCIWLGPLHLRQPQQQLVVKPANVPDQLAALINRLLPTIDRAAPDRVLHQIGALLERLRPRLRKPLIPLTVTISRHQTPPSHTTRVRHRPPRSQRLQKPLTLAPGTGRISIDAWNAVPAVRYACRSRKAQGRQVITCRSSDPLVAVGLALRRAGATTVLVANMTPQPQLVEFEDKLQPEFHGYTVDTCRTVGTPD